MGPRPREIEDQLLGLTELDEVSTTITDGSVSINVSFKVGKDSQVALDEVSNTVDQVVSDLPSGMETPNITKSDLNSSPLITYVVSSGHLDEAELSWLIDNDIEQLLMAKDGVGEVSRLGSIDREIQVSWMSISWPGWG